MKKFNKKFYIYNFLVRFIGFAALSFFYMISLLSSGESEEIIFDKTLTIIWLIVVAIYLVFLIIYELLLYKKSGYSIDEDGVRSKLGVLFKKNSFLSYDKMHAINERQGLIQRLFGIEGLYIDSGSTNTASQSEIAIYETKKEIKNILSVIETNKNKGINQKSITSVSEDIKTLEPIFSFTKKEKTKYLLIKTLQSLTTLIILYAIFIMMTLLIKQIDNMFITVALIILLMLLIIYVLAYLVESFLNLYDFKVYKTDKELIVKHGLFVKVNNKLPIKKIKAIRTKTSLFDRLFGYARIYVDVVGFEGTTSKGGATPMAGILIPYAKKDEISSYIQNLVENYDYQGDLTYKSRGLFPRMSVQLLVLTIIMLFSVLEFVLLYLTSVLTLAWFTVGLLSTLSIYLLIVALLSGMKYIENRIEGIEVEPNRLIISSRGFFNTKMVVKRENVIAIEDITTYWRQKKNIYSYRIHIHSNAFRNTILVNILDKDIKEKLFEFLNTDYIK